MSQVQPELEGQGMGQGQILLPGVAVPPGKQS